MDTIEALELNELQAFFVTCDGLSANRKFFQIASDIDKSLKGTRIAWIGKYTTSAMSLTLSKLLETLPQSNVKGNVCYLRTLELGSIIITEKRKVHQLETCGRIV